MGRRDSARLPRIAAFVQETIAQAIEPPSFRDLLTVLMARPEFVSTRGQIKWPFFVLDTCRVLGGDLESAIAATAAVEFAVAAIDVADDLIDEDWDENLGPRGRAVHASLALAWLAQRSASHLVDHLGAERARIISDIVVQRGVASCAGQDMDLLMELVSDVSEEQAHDVTLKKSGSLVAMACQVGAALATDDPTILDTVGLFGSHIGVVGQLLNDLAGVVSEGASVGSDLRRRKKTLPVAYTLRCAREEGLPLILAWYEDSRPPTDQAEERLAATIRDVGAVHYTWIVADAHRREALATLRTLAEVSGRPEALSLRRLVPMVRHSRSGSVIP